MAIEWIKELCEGVDELAKEFGGNPDEALYKWAHKLEAETPQLLLRRTGFLILDLQVIHDLLHVGHSRGHLLGMVALLLRIHFSGQCYHAVLDFIRHGVVHLILNQRSIQILLYTGVQIGVNCLCFFFYAGESPQFDPRQPGSPRWTLQ
jgi:hypothetical protein